MAEKQLSGAEARVKQPSARAAAAGARPAGSRPTGAASRPSSAPPPTPGTGISGAELATAFDGKLERVGVSFGYRLGIALVAGALVLLPAVYFAIVGLVAYATYWHATENVSIFSQVRPGRAVLAVAFVYVAPIIVGAILLLFMVLPLFWRASEKEPRPFKLDPREEPLLFAYVNQLCDAMRAPRPERIEVTATANASARMDNGLLGLFRRRLVLTLGLPLVNSMTLKQFTGVVAHEFGHFTQGSFMRLSYVVHRINAWFARMAWEPTGIDEALDNMAGDETHWGVALFVLLCRLALGIVRLVLKALALTSHALCMHLARQAEYDADRRAARIVGSVAMEDGLQMIPFIDVAHSLAVQHAESGWARRALPDDLILLTDRAQAQLPDPVKDSLTAAILTSEASWFDTHPPLYKRVGALKKANLQGVLKIAAPATAVFKDFDELCKLATLDYYYMALGDRLKPEYLYPTEKLLAAGARAGAGA